MKNVGGVGGCPNIVGVPIALAAPRRLEFREAREFLVLRGRLCMHGRDDNPNQGSRA